MGVKKNKKIQKFIKTRRPLVCLTAYTKYMAEIIDSYCDLILVGDSISMVLYGNENTSLVSLQTMINHGKAVRKGVSKSLLVVDMPKGSYEKSTKHALKNAKKIMNDTKCDAIKIEGGTKVKNIIKILVRNNIPVMGHIGLMPQQVYHLKDYRVKGRSSEEEQIIIDDLLAVQESGAFSVVIEAVPKTLADKLCKMSKIKTIGIGASNKCDGQILVTEDMLGFFDKNPKFVKKYAFLRNLLAKSVQNYKSDVISRNFPTKKNLY
jgi:3-methyl-2-oxobutanoate hydroxymethyltransferase